jgi:hypothetical protein
MVLMRLRVSERGVIYIRIIKYKFLFRFGPFFSPHSRVLLKIQSWVLLTHKTHDR